MTKVDLIYSDGLEALYLNGRLMLVDEIVDTERTLLLLEGRTVEKVTVNKIVEHKFIDIYGYDFPVELKDIDTADFDVYYH